MKYIIDVRGFPSLEHPTDLLGMGDPRILTQSSLAESRCLWIGATHHLNREQVTEVRDAMTRWLETGDIRKSVVAS